MSTPNNPTVMHLLMCVSSKYAEVQEAFVNGTSTTISYLKISISAGGKEVGVFRRGGPLAGGESRCCC